MSSPPAVLLLHVTLSTLDVNTVFPLCADHLICQLSGSLSAPTATAATAPAPTRQSTLNATMNLLLLDLTNLFVLDFIITFLD
jgi:hypothetical protein